MAYPTVDYDEPMLALGETSQIDSEKAEPIGLTAWGLMVVLLITGVYQAQPGLSWIPQVACVCLGVFWLVVDVLGKQRGIKIFMPHVLFLLMIMWESVCNLFSAAPLLAMWGVFSTKLKVFGVSLVAANIVRHRRQLLPVLIGCTVLPVIIMILFRDLVSETAAEMSRGVETDNYRLGEGEIGNTNAMARDANYALSAAAAVALLSGSSLVRLAVVATIPVTLAYIGYTGSRGGMATVVVQVFAFWFFYLRKLERFRGKGGLLGIAILAVLVVGAGLWIATSPYAFRFREAGHAYEHGRLQLMLMALRLFLDSPVFGTGTFGYELGAAAAGIKHTASHNLPSHLLAIGGLPLFSLYYTAWGVIFVKMWRLRERGLASADAIVVNLSFVILLAFHATTMTGTAMNPRYTFLLVGAIVGYVYGLQERFGVGEQAIEDEYESDLSLESDWQRSWRSPTGAH